MELAVRKQEPWHRPVLMEQLRKKEQELLHRQLVEERKLELVQHRNTEQEEYKELERAHRMEQREQLRMPVAEARKLVLGQHHKIVAEECKKKQQERFHMIAVGKLELVRLHKLGLLEQRHKKEPEQIHMVGVEDKPELEPHRLEQVVRKPEPEVYKEQELRQRTLIQHHKMELVAHKTRRIVEPVPGRNLPLVDGQRGLVAGYQTDKSRPEDRDEEVGRI
jgi:hypothetical protein